MKTHSKKRIEIMIESPLLGRITETLDAHGVTGYTVLPALAGRGEDGAWHRDGVIGRAGSLVMVISIIDADRVQSVLEPLFKLVKGQIGIVTVSDVEVIRPDRF
ncbi:MAG: DUF190 domain-containing protein [Pseudomonadota bacterium]